MVSSFALGERLKGLRKQRGLSQLALSLEVGVSTKHLSFVETGRSAPSVEMMNRLSEGLELPLRERNELLNLAGYVSHYSEEPLEAPQLQGIMTIVRTLLKNQEPFPALAMDRYWDIVEMNQAAARMFGPLLTPGQIPNAVEIFLGNPLVQSMVDNWVQLAHHTRERLRAQVRRIGPGDARMVALGQRGEQLLEGVDFSHQPPPGPALTTRLLIGGQVIKTVSTVASFAGAGDATVEDLRIELVFPADAAATACFEAAAGK